MIVYLATEFQKLSLLFSASVLAPFPKRKLPLVLRHQSAPKFFPCRSESAQMAMHSDNPNIIFKLIMSHCCKASTYAGGVLEQLESLESMRDAVQRARTLRLLLKKIIIKK